MIIVVSSSVPMTIMIRHLFGALHMRTVNGTAGSETVLAMVMAIVVTVEADYRW